MRRIMVKRVILCGVASIIFAYFSCLFAAEKKFKEKSSTHFIVYYKPDVAANFVDDIIKSAESYYEEIAANLGFQRYKFWLWDERATIYIFGDKESYIQETNQPDWTGGCADYRNKKLWTYPHAVGFFDSVLPHELGHIIFREFVGFGRNIPLWLDEGVAGYQEKSKRYAAKAMVRELIANGKLLSFEQLNAVSSSHNLNPEHTEAFYAESVSIVYFLIDTFNKDRFVTFCRRLKEQRNFDAALDTSYYNFKNAGDLYKQWLQSIKNEPR